MNFVDGSKTMGSRRSDSLRAVRHRLFGENDYTLAVFRCWKHSLQ
jgi:hypothetical protein